MNRKERIPDNIKNLVWLKHAKYNDLRYTQCCTCENIVMIPESIRKYHKLDYDILNIIVNGEKINISGTGEFGHIISEKNGGTVNTDNLIIQCKTCNTKQSYKDIDLKTIDKCDAIMIDFNINDNIEMGIYNEICSYTLNSGERCKNRCVFNRDRCYIHLIK